MDCPNNGLSNDSQAELAFLLQTRTSSDRQGAVQVAS